LVSWGKPPVGRKCKSLSARGLNQEGGCLVAGGGTRRKEWGVNLPSTIMPEGNARIRERGVEKSTITFPREWVGILGGGKKLRGKKGMPSNEKLLPAPGH